MSQRNMDLARQATEAIDRRDQAAWLALHDEDFGVIASDGLTADGAVGPRP
jgi:ketosteroid isomerase-like protein